VTTSFVWHVTGGRATRSGCFVFVDETQFVGDALRCRTS
jgi:hypothetical protein